MPTPLYTEEQALADIREVESAVLDGHRKGSSPSAYAVAAQRLGISTPTMQSRMQVARQRYGLEPDWSLQPIRVSGRDKPSVDPSVLEAHARRAEIPVEDQQDPGRERILRRLQAGPHTLEELSRLEACSPGAALDAVLALRGQGYNVEQHGEAYLVSTHREPAVSSQRDPELELDERYIFESAPDNTYRFGFATDTHLCSKYQRLDVLQDLYRRFEAAGCSRVYNAGNWVDGEMSGGKNRHQLMVHGMHAQIRYLVEHYPAVEGMPTYAIWGDDHEGWWAQREGIDVGGYAEREMRDAGRSDWYNLGFMEAHVLLRNANNPEVCATMAVVHPGGGSAYAVSYRPQKIIESYEGGEKPAVLLLGHYHKMEVIIVRNVWCIQGGCTQEVYPFTRKTPTEFHIGGVIVELEQDPVTGAIIGCGTKMLRYFDKGYYRDRNDRWSHHDQPHLPTRDFLGDARVQAMPVWANPKED